MTDSDSVEGIYESAAANVNLSGSVSHSDNNCAATSHGELCSLLFVQSQLDEQLAELFCATTDLAQIATVTASKHTRRCRCIVTPIGITGNLASNDFIRLGNDRFLAC